MANWHSRDKKVLNQPLDVKSPKKLSIAKQKSLAAIKTAGDLGELLNEINIPRIDVDELLSETMKDEFEELEDIVSGEDSDSEGLRDEYNDLEDDYKDYDEMGSNDPFDIEGKDTKYIPRYVAVVSFEKERPIIRFLQAPQYDTHDVLVRNALIERYNLFHEIAGFIAGVQKFYFKTKNEANIANLNQQDLVEFFRGKNYKISKVHVTRMLSALYFSIEGLGILPSKFFFKRYGHKTGLRKDEKESITLEFLNKFDKNLNQLEMAKELVKFIEQKTGKTIKLSDSQNEHDQYKQWKNIIRKVKSAKK